MKLKLLVVAVIAGAFAWSVAPAAADTGGGGGGPGAAQVGVQSASTGQLAGAAALSNQNAVNANTPSNTAGGNITTGPSSANQLASSSADAKATNDADTTQKQDQTQNVNSGSCSVGCGGAGAAQIGAQLSDTNQDAKALAVSDQNAVNSNVPVNVAGGNITSGPSSANQIASSEADAKASNDADTTQKQKQTQNVDGSSCHVGCGGPGAAQLGVQAANTEQGAASAAISKQNAVNANVPVNVAGGNITSGPSSANQIANSEAEAKSSNDADTTQKQDQTQNVGGDSSCYLGCGGAGAAQIGVQAADTQQWAGSAAISKQNAVNANVPVNVAGGDITSGPSSANQIANSEAEAKSSNDADTTQKQDQTQNVGGDPSCLAGCGGAGGFQLGIQKADTQQWAGSFALSDQNAVNANTPVNVAGGNITSGPSSANQWANSEAEAKSSNDADTTQKQKQDQTVGSDSSCYFGCGGPGGAQIGIQKAETEQGAFAAGLSLQNAVNSNAPHSIAGGNIYAGPSSANQWASSEAEGKAFNDADTFQWASQYQKVG
jgi:phage gp45-like